MKIQKPTTFMGKPIKGAMKRALAKAKTSEPKKSRQSKGRPVQVSAQINFQDYVQVPKEINGKRYVIAKIEPDWTKRFKWENKDEPLESAHYKLAEKGTEMPTPALFTTHFNNVILARQDKLQIYDGLGNLIDKSEIEDIYRHLTSAHINGGAWSHLNARFKKARQGDDYQAWDIEKVTGVISDGSLITQSLPLEQCVWDDCFVSLKFNKQGLATHKSGNEDYNQGQNIWFYYPRNNCVARFSADSDRADLDCDRNPDGSGASLGVFVCAREASATR